MMKAFKIFSMAAVAFMMVACSSEDEALDNTPVAGRKVHFTATIAAPGSDASTRTTYTEVTSGTDAGKIKVAWEQGDEIALIHNGTKDVVTVQTLNADGSANISGDITVGTDGEAVTIVYPAASVDAPTSGAEPVDNATYVAKWNSQDGTLTYIQDYLDFCRATSTLKVSGTNATLNDNIALKSNIAIVKFSLTDGTNAINASKFFIMDGSNNVVTTVTPTSANSELYVAMQPATTSTFRFVATDGTSGYTYTKTGATIEKGKFYQSEISLTTGIFYLDKTWNGTAVTSIPSVAESGTYSVVSDANLNWAAGTYVVTDNVTITGYVTLTGDSKLILCNGKTLTVNGALCGGIYGGSYYALSIYGQSDEASTRGILNVKSQYFSETNVYKPAMGYFSTLDIYGGDITSEFNINDLNYMGILSSPINVYGGKLNVKHTANYGSGINNGIHGGNITIYDGDVVVSKCNKNGYGIRTNGTLIVNGGKLLVSSPDTYAINGNFKTGTGISYWESATGTDDSWGDAKTAPNGATSSAKYVKFEK